jgi:hypothetical protein
MRSKFVFLAVVFFLLPTLLNAQYIWQEQFPFLPSFSFPVELVSSKDGSNRFFVVQQRGIIYAFENISGVSTRKVFLDISDRVSQSGSEMGLLGLAFHPNYPDSGYLYLNYTSSSSGLLRSYITRYSVSSANPDSALHNSEVVLLTVDQPYINHNGGKVAFGPDGYLYIGFGDGGSGNDPENRAQDRTTLLGKILRINVDSAGIGLRYSIPTTNPYYKNMLGYREEIYASGIRNPWKFSFDPVTGNLWLGDVGQDTREEVDIVSNGGNYGWHLKEGFICTPVVNPTCQDTAGLLAPVWDYSHNGASASITGGYVYRGSGMPTLYGKYIFGDYVTGKTWALTYDGINPGSVTPLTDETYLISTFGLDTSGNIYLCSYGSSSKIYKLIEQATGATGGGENTPTTYQLFQNFPNPFNPRTVISYRLSQISKISLKIYDLLGREVKALVNEVQPAGIYSVDWIASDMPSGVYFYKSNVNGNVQMRKMILQK